MPFNQMMGLPVVLTLARDEGGPLALRVNPVRELESLRDHTTSLPAQDLGPDKNPLAGVDEELLELVAEFEPGTSSEVVLSIRGLVVSYDTARQELSVLGHRATLKPVRGRVRLHLFIDRASLDVFANDGRLYMPMGIIVPASNHSLEIRTRAGEARLVSLVVHRLQSAWE